jgi:hypothetical protein
MAATEVALGELHVALANTLKDLVGVEAPSAAVLAVAAKFLKDNNVTCTPSSDNAMGELEAAIARRKQKTGLSLKEKQELGGVADVEHLMH